MVKRDDRPICENCESSNIYVTDKLINCRRCGHKKKREDIYDGK